MTQLRFCIEFLGIMNTKMFKTNLVYSLIIAAITNTAVGAITLPSEAASFIDNFDDGVVDTSIYSPIGDAQITESNGMMTVVMPTTGTGVFISLDDVIPDARCWDLSFNVDEFPLDQGLIFEHIFSSNLTSNFTAFRTTFTQTNSVKVKTEAFDQNGNLVEIPDSIKPGADGKLGTADDILNPKTFIVEALSFKGDFTFRLDLVNGSWVVDSKKGIEEKNPLVDLFKIQAAGAIENIPGLKFTGLRVTSSANQDPIVAFRSVMVKEIHSVPEPSSTLSLLALSALGVASTLKRKQK